MSNTIEECELKRMVDAKHRKMMTVKYELQELLRADDSELREYQLRKGYPETLITYNIGETSTEVLTNLPGTYVVILNWEGTSAIDHSQNPFEGIFYDSTLTTGYLQQALTNSAVTGGRFVTEVTDGKHKGTAMLYKSSTDIFVGDYDEGWFGPCKIVSEEGSLYAFAQGEILTGHGEFHPSESHSTIYKLIKGPIDSSTGSIGGGEGVIYLSNGGRFEGEISQYRPVNGSLYNEKDELVYEGDLDENCLPSGEGTQYQGPVTYKGGFTRGLLDGEISYYNNETKEEFHGIYANGIAFGDGHLKIPAKDLEYEGRFKLGKFRGPGKLREGNIVYDGYFINGNFTGEGVVTIKTEEKKQVYRGNFVNGELYGKGVYDSGAGYIYSGRFHKGLFQGFGKFYYEDGVRFEGLFEGGKREGFGRLFNEEGKIVVEGQWVNDVHVKEEEVEEAGASGSKAYGDFEEFARKHKEKLDGDVEGKSEGGSGEKAAGADNITKFSDFGGLMNHQFGGILGPRFMPGLNPSGTMALRIPTYFHLQTNSMLSRLLKPNPGCKKTTLMKLGLSIALTKPLLDFLKPKTR